MLEGMRQACEGLEGNYERRAEVSRHYADALSSHDGVVVPTGAALGQPLLRFPLLLASAQQAVRVFRALKEAGFYPGRWYRPTLFPGPTRLEPYRYDPQSCPIAEQISQSILNLPTDLSMDEARKIVQTLAAAL
jgi:dTDP-4-amino-4,6-dideoxygalactose transaminase